MARIFVTAQLLFLTTETLAEPFGDSTPEQRWALFDTILKMLIRVEGGDRGSYQKDEALEQYKTIRTWLHNDQKRARP